jgi:CxxC motif-containing protein (DUF1111 family)
MADFLRDLARPVQVMPESSQARQHVENGAKQFGLIGCADCHTPDVGPIKGFYSNLLIHEMGADLASSNGYNGDPPVNPQFDNDEGLPPADTEWRTPPLWGVADSAPYLHDGRAETLEKAIALHGGEASAVTKRFEELPTGDQDDLIAFLKTLRAPGTMPGERRTQVTSR